MNAQKAAIVTREKFTIAWDKFTSFLDREEIRAFQGMYYGVFATASALLIWVPNINAGHSSQSLSPNYYVVWLLLMLICPVLTLFGRRLTTRAALKPLGEPNSAYGAALLQLTGDLGVWGALCVFVATTSWAWWKENFIFFALGIMCLLGGLMFTIRSVRRLVGIERRTKHVKKFGWD